ncbi:MAG: hypothetical protein U0521_06495 [Anaerolineae bacterium]
MWTITGTPASHAAMRPTKPAFAVCVWTTSGLRRRMSLYSRQMVTMSRSGWSERPSSGTMIGWTPCASA